LLDSPIERLLNPHIKNLDVKRSLSRPARAILLDKGELPYPPSPKVIKAVARAAAEINRYPETLGGSLRSKLAQYTDKPPEQIVIGNGSDDLIELIVKVFVQPGEEVILPIPTFFVYEFATKVCGGIPLRAKRTADFDLNVGAILDQVSKRTKVIFIANPNNPTANLVDRQTLIALLERVNCLVVIDECYFEFSRETAAGLVDRFPNLLILRSLSKSFGLAGLRVGYAIAQAPIVEFLYRAAQLFPVSRLAIAAANAALADIDYIQANIQKIERNKSFLARELEKLGLVTYPSATNFLFVGTRPSGLTSAELVQSLQQQGIWVADFGLKQGLDGYYFRTAIGTDDDNRKLLTALGELVPGNCSCQID
jgi:histidinol-phosphate aminotransferase